MKAQKTTLAGALACAALVALSPTLRAEDLAASLKATTEQEAKDGQMAIATKNVDSLINYYADNAWVLAPNEPIHKTREAIKTSWQEGVNSGGFDGLSWWPVRTEVSGDMGVEYGEYDVKDADGKVVSKGKYLAVWKHTDAGWKMIADTWNTSDPLPEAK